MSQESVEAAYRRKLASNPDGEMDYITLQISHPLHESGISRSCLSP
nr:MAG TPA: hypothetical protein [Caudoviricetes sp.]